MVSEACLTEIKRAAGVEFTDDELEHMLDGLIKAKSRIMADRALSSDDALRAAAEELAGRLQAAAAIEKRNALLNLQARVSRRARIMAAPNLIDGIKAEVHGINTPIEGGRFSGEAEYKALNRVYQDGLVGELERAGLFKAARDGSLERDWARELFELSKGQDGKPGVTGSKEALDIARIVDRYQTLAKENLNKAGGWIGDYAGYITRTSHDADKIRRAGFEDWAHSLRDQLDPRTFDDAGGASAEHPAQFLSGVYHALITGVHLTEEGMQGYKDPAFTGPANMAGKLSEGRVLHFKDAESWLDYQARFGQPSVIAAVTQNLDRSARATALMRRWGTNPRAEFANDVRFLKEHYRDSDPEAVNRLKNAEKILQDRFDFLDGTANQPANRLFARIGSATRIWTSMSKLGGVVLTHLSVGATKAAELRYQGVGLLPRYGDFLASFGRGRGMAGGQTRQVMDLLLAGHEGMLRDLLSRFEPDDGMPGTLSKLAGTFFKWGGLTYVLNAQRAGAEFTMARHLGSMLDLRHGEMPPETRRILGMFGIGKDEWNLLRAAPDHAQIDGRQFLTPKAAANIDPAAAEAHLRAAGALADDAKPETVARKIDDLKADLAIRLHAYFNDRSEFVTIVPGVNERAMLLRGARPGTVEGEALRFFAQFKQWPAAMISKAWGREIYGGQGPSGALSGLLQMAVTGTLLGYGVMSAKDLAKGREPRNPADLKSWFAAFTQGGGAGILGDYLFGEYNRFGQNFSETVAGPVLGQGVNTALDLFNRAKQGKDLKPTAFRALIDNTPFINLFYTRLALDYGLLWHVQEAMSPGYQRRFERHVKSQNDQTFWLSPAKAVGR